jgi:small subunit ribosomal protein S29
VNSSTTYTYDMRTQTYAQPVFAFETLKRLLESNMRALKALKTEQSVAIERRADVPAGTPLVDLIQLGLRDQAIAPTVLEAVLAELGLQTK